MVSICFKCCFHFVPFAICTSRLRFASLRFPWPLHGLVQLSEACDLCATATQKLQQRPHRCHTVTINATKEKYEMKKTVPKTLPKTSSKCKTSEKVYDRVYESISFTVSYYFIKHVGIFRPCSQDCRYLICR